MKGNKRRNVKSAHPGKPRNTMTQFGSNLFSMKGRAGIVTKLARGHDTHGFNNTRFTKLNTVLSNTPSN